MATVSLPGKAGKIKIMKMNSHYLTLPLIGKLKVISNNNSIIEIKYITETPGEDLKEGGAIPSKNFFSTYPAEVKKLKDQLIEYLKADRREFQIEYQLAGTDFQQAILDETAKIPYGQTVSYKELAKRAGSPRAWQATGQALKNNRLPIIIPCHRVICSSGIGGYNGGLKLKKTLLKLEGSIN